MLIFLTLMNLYQSVVESQVYFQIDFLFRYY